MRLLLSLVLLLLPQARVPGPGGAIGGGGGGGGGVAIVAHSVGHAVDNAVTGSIDTTGANFIYCTLSAYTGGPADSFGDNKGNTWVPLTSVHNTAGNARSTDYYVVSPTVGAGHTFTNSAVGSYSTIECAAYSGVKTATTPFERENGASDLSYGGSVALQPGSVAVNTTGDLVITTMLNPFGNSGTNDVATIDSGFTFTDQFHQSAVTEGASFAYLITSSTSALNPGWSPQTTGGYALHIAVFAKQ